MDIKITLIKMKIAIVTSDGKTVNQHFGRSPYYAIISIENGKIVDAEMRQRGTGHFARNQMQHQHQEEHHHDENKTGLHGYDKGSQEKHNRMAAEISDCKVLIAGGMGRGAYEQFLKNNIKVIMTDKRYLQEVVELFIKGELPNLYMDRTH
jgi:predicted Fe-Mo cluster-binding NifX family protein